LTFVEPSYRSSIDGEAEVCAEDWTGMLDFRCSGKERSRFEIDVLEMRRARGLLHDEQVVW
jgi:hypothetical protein